MSYICRQCGLVVPHYKNFHWVEKREVDDGIEVFYNSSCGPVVSNNWLNRLLMWANAKVKIFKGEI